ncbi:STAS domain-containing protein [Amycolatopsis sp. SID8362]|uniref:STAS domain-containing protein n=1 Tax=Amycolatopsis sp. SID8362 TaxID=2690346 RepID=UPI001369863A|nr:STAS domain-containing protein [Amycolatopsis sp. SID8362]NBH02191.1 STAS domain-containing protein [Amycolatopsis sp. SID8362]NED38894.1 STAS domain-containing protein [Amycolatopsis sp. SID8362]
MTRPDDEQHRALVAALREWARQVDSVPYPAKLDIDALLDRYYESRPAPPPAASLVLTATADATVVAVSGDIDLACGDRLHDRLAEEIGLAPRGLVLDLTGVRHCSARGVALLHEVAGRAHRAGVPFALAGCPAVVLRAIETLRLGPLRPLHPTVADALEWLGILTRLRAATSPPEPWPPPTHRT